MRDRERKLLLRNRIAITGACIVAVALIGVSLTTWLVTEHNLRDQLDRTLVEKTTRQRMVLSDGSDSPPQPREAPETAMLCGTTPVDKSLRNFIEDIELLRADGRSCGPEKSRIQELPGDRGVDRLTLRDGSTLSGIPVRLALRPLENGDVLVYSRPLADIEDTLAGLRDVLIAVCFLGIVGAAVTGLVLTRRALSPMQRLTTAAEHIARTQDLNTPIEVSGRDETGRLATAFAAMTAALRDSRQRQRRLVTDAAHELRTPLTSLRTNIELLGRSARTGKAIPAERHTEILDRLTAQATEFGELIGELVELARDETELARTPVAIHEVVERAVHRATIRAPEHEFDVDSAEWTVLGDAAALERAVLNLLDNAVKFAPPGSVITVRSVPGEITVTDQGPGIAAAQRSKVFERFWRAPEARALPGSGLGLAIVATVAGAHGGSAEFVEPPQSRGARARISLPISG
ncbi:sensor histidine kinase [Sciscionella sediminilitoris]|uniref:sensor histidine kinase n=1 Tax=Sciscionella sediminilitoris TaxID=1445613 RepID=UPI0004DFCD4F|nr:HAMP domain-containing sensor histidine kinase [Sciscionella sp. SE31]